MNAPTLFKRQRVLLALLHSLGGRSSMRDFQKLLFLYCMECADEAPYDFVPYRYGGFSFTSYADRRKLAHLGLLEDTEHEWALTEAGTGAIQSQTPLLRATSDFCRAQPLRGAALTTEAYRRFPYFAARSTIVDRLDLQDHEKSRIALEAAKLVPDSPALLTIGYEGLSLESYLNKLLRARVTLLCDVRKNPLSRKYGFSKKTLSNACEGIGVRYEHLPALGIPSIRRKGLHTLADYQDLFRAYEEDTLPFQQESLKTIADWLAAGERVALTCFEESHHHCHRHCVAGALQAMEPDLPPIHHL